MSGRVIVVANDHVGSSMAGPGIRSLHFAEQLATRYDVTLSVPYPCDLQPTSFELVHEDSWDAPRMTHLTRGARAVVTQRLPVETMRALARSRTRAIYDLYAPVTIENLAFDAPEASTRRRTVAYRLNTIIQDAALATGDAFICASSRQRDFWLGWLAANGRLGHRTYAHDPSLRSLVEIVPFGIDQAPPRAAHPVLKGVVDGIGLHDKVLLWGGGIWNWFDPETVIRAVAELSRRRDDVKLFFLGLTHPNPHVPQMEASRRAVVLARDLGLTGRSVFFNESWVPYQERAGYFLEADIGVSAHFDDVETRLAFRTRLLDCFWAGLPVVTTRGDALADEVQRRQLGRVVDFGDVDGWIRALESLLDDRAARTRIDAALEEIRRDLAWPCVVEPVFRLIEDDLAAPRPRRLDPFLARYSAARVENALAIHGATGGLSRAARRAASAIALRIGR